MVSLSVIPHGFVSSLSTPCLHRMSFDLGVFYVREDLQKRWYITQTVNPDDKIMDLAQVLDDRAGEGGQYFTDEENEESEERDFTGIAGEVLPHFWKLRHCGVTEGCCVISRTERPSAFVPAGETSGHAARTKAETKTKTKNASIAPPILTARRGRRPVEDARESYFPRFQNGWTRRHMQTSLISRLPS